MAICEVIASAFPLLLTPSATAREAPLKLPRITAMQHVIRVGLRPLRSLRPLPRTPLLRSPLCTGTPKPGAMVSRPAADAAQQMPDAEQLNFHLNLEKLTGSITETTTDGTDDADTDADGHRMGPPSAVSARALAYDPDAPASGMNMEQLLDFFRAADDDARLALRWAERWEGDRRLCVPKVEERGAVGRELLPVGGHLDARARRFERRPQLEPHRVHPMVLAAVRVRACREAKAPRRVRVRAPLVERRPVESGAVAHHQREAAVAEGEHQREGHIRAETLGVGQRHREQAARAVVDAQHISPRAQAHP